MSHTDAQQVQAGKREGFYPLSPHRLISLWDMIEFLAGKAWAILFSLESHYKAAQWAVEHHGTNSIPTSDYWSQLLQLFSQVETICQTLELTKSQARLNHFQIVAVTKNTLNTVIVSELFGLRRSIIEEIAEHKFAFIPIDKRPFFEKEDLFGYGVSEAFPSAVDEIKDAGNCLAAELDTAAVFHSMRVAEHGLRALARHLRIRLKHKLEYEDWGTICGAVQKKLNRLEAKPRGKKKSEELEFYRIALSECNKLKDVWRNNVMHTRGRYNWPEAVGVYLHVCDFMQRLATRIRES